MHSWGRSLGARAISTLGTVLVGALFVASGVPASAQESPEPEPSSSPSVSASARPTPSASGEPAVPSKDPRVRPLPPPVPVSTPLKVKHITQMAPDACNPWIPDQMVAQKHSWHLERLNMDEVWRIATGKGIRVAVIDTGMAIEGSDHTPTTRFEAYDVLPPKNENKPEEPYDCGHGTSVAALIGASQAGSVTDFSGIAPDAHIIGIRSLYGNDVQDPDGTIDAVARAIEMDVDVINISQATLENRADYAAVIQKALDAGIVVVAAAGNANAMPVGAFAYPAAYPGVIAVGMTDRADVAHPNSFPMPGYVSVGAPGSDLVSIKPSTRTNGQVYYNLGNGTSYAAPIVSGVVALMLEKARADGVELTPAQVKRRLEETADPPAGPVPDPRLGYGVVNPLRALSGVAAPHLDAPPTRHTPSYTPLPTPEPENPYFRPIAMVTAGLSIMAVVLGIVIVIALPPARRRKGLPAQPGENVTDRP